MKRLFSHIPKTQDSKRCYYYGPFISLDDGCDLFSVQVAALQRADLSKCDHEGLAAALNDVSQSLTTAMASKEEDIQEGIKISGLGGTPAWLLGVGEAFVSSLKAKHGSLCKSLGEEKTRADEMIAKMPSVDNESNYRQETLRLELLKPLAQCAVGLESGHKDFQSIVLTQKKLSNLKFGADHQLQFEADDTSASGLVPAAANTSAMASFHVAAVSSLCILRSDDVGKSSQLPDKTVQNLKNAYATLQGKCKKLPEEQSALTTFGQAILDEMGRVISRASKSAGAQKSEKGQEGMQLVEAKPGSKGSKEEKKSKDKKEKKKDKEKEKDKESKCKKDKKSKKRDHSEEVEDLVGDDGDEINDELDDIMDELLDDEKPEPEATEAKKEKSKSSGSTPQAKPAAAKKAKAKAQPAPKPDVKSKSKKKTK